jgi:3'-phosphoadenosine 5'-phosphosulfate sulfotransferase (PAPS reductase)/FAD synthetase
MDWPCTRDYCRKVAAAFGVPLYFSWKVGGFEREMMRADAPTAPTKFEMPEYGQAVGKSLHLLRIVTQQVGGVGPQGTRLLFPQVSPDLSVRWCSAYLKIDVGSTALRNQERFNRARTLFVTGERAEESASRAKYKTFEPHRSDGRDGRKKRHVDQWRPVHGWEERYVWNIIERFRVNPHPAYRLGWGRVSCMRCIFGNADQWASARAVDAVGFAKVATYEALSGKTIQRKLSVVQQANAGEVYGMNPADVAAAMAEEFAEPVFLDNWNLPRGAYGDSCGPT